jgi:hypothetical protein
MALSTLLLMMAAVVSMTVVAPNQSAVAAAMALPSAARVA